MAEYIERNALENAMATAGANGKKEDRRVWARAICLLHAVQTADVAPVVHGRWILEAHKDRANCRWNVIAECSECCDERKEIWSGFFPNVPDCIARDASLISAEKVEISNYCPNCGAKMDLEEQNNA